MWQTAPSGRRRPQTTRHSEELRHPAREKSLDKGKGGLGCRTFDQLKLSVERVVSELHEAIGNARLRSDENVSVRKPRLRALLPRGRYRLTPPRVTLAPEQ